MHLYWRIQSDLNEFGDFLILIHPNLSREFETWVKKNAGGLALAEDLIWNGLERFPSNQN